ncbi:hypothetical protein P154DRAFT_580459 [Amniculicola lignicola CBS 123094]|uniref:Uncharacterized protein n=1 Tax=Amniculicola lignicola CBS 123094 TaxID=1392246 RepID=A0A6A5WE52_9PLEO|nr:hypothetical protein P154DRAFT_580459 [Amniculicola lignicola CBS 123094]
MGCCCSKCPTLQVEVDQSGPRPTMSVCLRKETRIDTQNDGANENTGEDSAPAQTLGGEGAANISEDAREAARRAAEARAGSYRLEVLAESDGSGSGSGSASVAGGGRGLGIEGMMKEVEGIGKERGNKMNKRGGR